MGGLISFYGAMRDRDVYSKVGVFDASFWFNDPSLFEWIQGKEKTTQQYYYFLIGGQEGSQMINPTVEMYTDMIELGFDEKNDLMLVYREDGQHAEWFWSREF